jgi:predicted transcriptional regulator
MLAALKEHQLWITFIIFCLFTLSSASVSVLQTVLSNSSYESTVKWETFRFQREQIVCACLAGASVTKTANLLSVSRAAVSKVMMAYKNHGKTSSAKKNRGQKPQLRERDCLTLIMNVSNNYRSTAAKIKAELNIYLEYLVSNKNNLTRASQIQHSRYSCNC